MDDIFHTVQSPAEGIYKEKGSKFIAFVFPVDDESTIKQHIESLKKQYYDARHHCYAYAIGPKREKYRTFDDREPSGTAGKPIFSQILSFNLTNVLIVVVRYFGGTLLGKNGLSKAYKSAAYDALSKAKIIKKTVDSRVKITFEMAALSMILNILKNMDAKIVSQNYDHEYLLIFDIRKSLYDEVKNKIISFGNINWQDI